MKFFPIIENDYEESYDAEGIAVMEPHEARAIAYHGDEDDPNYGELIPGKVIRIDSPSAFPGGQYSYERYEFTHISGDRVFAKLDRNVGVDI